MRENDARQKFDAMAFEQKGKLLRANLFAAGTRRVAMRVDPGFDTILLRVSIRTDHERATRVVLGDPGDELGVFLERTGLLAVHREIDQRRARHRAFAFLPKLFQLLVDLSELDRLA